VNAAKLPPQAWTAEPRAAAMLDALGVGADEVRMVGGAVRDALLGVASADIDLATVHPPEEVTRRAEAAGCKAVPTGIEHGTVTVIAGGRPFEVTTLRRDVSTDGRRATVAFTHEWREDAARRDFTMNALYARPLTGELIDYFGGVDDLAGGRVRFIGEAAARIAEDHLRILRFFRFHARFGRGAPDADGLAACVARRNDLMALSRERVRDELLKLLAVGDPVPTVALMVAEHVLEPVLPEVRDVAALAALVRAEAAAACAEAPPALAVSPLRRLAALLPADAAVLESVAYRLRLSTAERKRLEAAALRGGALPETLSELAYWNGPEIAADLWLLSGRAPGALAALAAWSRPKLPLSGGDLIAAGMDPGPAVAARLKRIEESWVASGFTLGRDELLRTR
jgi:poly(A) polymerase